MGKEIALETLADRLSWLGVGLSMSGFAGMWYYGGFMLALFVLAFVWGNNCERASDAIRARIKERVWLKYNLKNYQ